MPSKSKNKRPKILVLEIEHEKYGYLGTITDTSMRKRKVIWFQTRATRDDVLQEAYAYIELSNDMGFGPYVLNEIL